MTYTPADGWLRPDEMAAVLGIARRTLSDVLRRLPAEGRAQAGARVYVHGPAVVRLWQRRQAHQHQDQDGEDGQDQPSEALERWRTARAEAAELDLAARRGELVPATEVEAVLDAVAAKVKALAEDLQRQHGPAAAERVQETLAELVALAERQAAAGVLNEG